MRRATVVVHCAVDVLCFRRPVGQRIRSVSREDVDRAEPPPLHPRERGIDERRSSFGMPLAGLSNGTHGQSEMEAATAGEEVPTGGPSMERS